MKPPTLKKRPKVSNIPAEKRITNARTMLILDYPWFGHLAMKLVLRETDKVPTAATDGTFLFFNPEFICTLTDAEVLGVVCHEVLHNAMRHPYRRKSRDHVKFNIAGDLAVNPWIVEAQKKKEHGQAEIALFEGALLDPQFEDMSAEEIYARLNEEHGYKFCYCIMDPQGGEGEKDGDGESIKPMSEVDWEIAVEQADLIAKNAGKNSGGMERLVELTRTTAAEFDEVLRYFIQSTMPTDYSWAKPNKKHVHNGTYLPGFVKENLPRIAVIVDSSGSTYYEPGLLDLFASKLTALMDEYKPEGLDIIYCDTDVAGTESFDDGEEVSLHIKGGGGTLFQPAFNYLNNLDEQPICVIYMTDLESADKPTQPDYPVLWVTAEHVKQKGPFGETVRLRQY